MQPFDSFRYLFIRMLRIKVPIVIILLSFSSVLCVAQSPSTNPYYNATNNWIIGDSLGISWNSDTVKFSLGRKNNIPESSSSLSDSNGVLLLYCNGKEIYNAKDSLLINGLLGQQSSTQGSLIINDNDSSIAIVTTPAVLNSENSCRYNLIEYQSPHTVLVKNKVLFKNSSEKLTGHLHSNNKGNWIIGHDNSQSFFSFYQREGRLQHCPIVSKTGVDLSNQFASVQGQMKISPSGKYCAIATHSLNSVYIYLFDDEAGVIGELQSFSTFKRPYAFSFSPSEQYLYAVEEFGDVIQINVLNGDTTKVGSTRASAFTGICRNNKNQIVISRVTEPFLDVIEYPDSLGIACGFVSKKINLPARCNFGLPNFNASYFYTPSIDFAYTEDCWGHSYSFEGRDTLQATSWKWIFSKVNSSQSSVINGKNCVYTFSDTGRWEVSHIAITATGSDTITKTLTIKPKWQQDVLGKDTFYCDGTVANITLQAPDDMHCVHWNGEEPNLDSALGKIIDYDHFHSDTLLVDTAGTYIVKLTNKTFCQAWDTITISEYPTPSKSGISRFKDSIVSNTVAQTYRWYRDGVPQLETTDRRLKPDSNGTWQVQLVSEYGCDSELSDSLLVGFASIPSIKATNPLSFKVYPNPSDGNITIAVPKGGDYQVLIYDMTGKLIYNTSQSLSLLFELELELVSGTYLLTLTDEDGNVGTKQVVVK